jgi:hypothetical protein
MTDLNTLRQALHSAGTDDLRGPDIGQIMVRGRRVRRRRRLLAGCGAACLAVALIATSQLWAPAGAQRGNGEPPAARGNNTAPGTSASPAPSPRPPKPVGSVIRTGITNRSGELVFYAVRVRVKELPRIHFGIMAGYRNAAGRVSALVETNETAGSGTAPGFHAIEGAMPAGRHPVPEFGYYAGPAVRITGMVGGQQARAHWARWSVNPKIVIFWFALSAARGGDVTALAAYDAAGHRLPTGNATVGHG